MNQIEISSFKNYVHTNDFLDSDIFDKLPILNDDGHSLSYYDTYNDNDIDVLNFNINYSLH